MKLTVHMIAAKPTATDPFGERDMAVLLWGEDKEVVELPKGESAVDQAAWLALTMAADLFRLASPPGREPDFKALHAAVTRQLDAMPKGG